MYIARAPALHASLCRLFREPFRTLHRLIHRLAVEAYVARFNRMNPTKATKVCPIEKTSA